MVLEEEVSSLQPAYVGVCMAPYAESVPRLPCLEPLFHIEYYVSLAVDSTNQGDSTLSFMIEGKSVAFVGYERMLA